VISVIVCHNQGTLVYEACKSLFESVLLHPIEIIVVTSLYLHHPIIEELKRQDRATKIIQYPGPPAGKRNYALKFARGNLIAFFDDDIEATEGSIRELYKLFDNPKIGMVFGKLRNMEFRNRFDEAGGFLTWTGFIWARSHGSIKDEGQFDKPEPIFAGKSAACMIRRDVFDKVGRFDEDFGILGEESDLAWRVWLSGFQVWWCPASLTFHAFNTRFKPKDFYTHERVYFNGCRNYIAMLVKNLELWNLIRILPFHLMAWLLASAGMICSGKLQAGFHILRGLAYTVCNFSVLMRKREKIQEWRARPERELIPLIFRKVSYSYYLQRMLRYFKVGLHG